MDIDNLQKLGIGVVIIALLIGVGLVMLSEFNNMDNLKFDSSAAENETLTQGTTALAQNDLIAVVVSNETREIVVASTNYTVDLDRGEIALVAASELNNTDFAIDYTFYYESPANNATIDNITALADIPTWVPIIILVVIIVILLGFVTMLKGANRS